MYAVAYRWKVQMNVPRTCRCRSLPWNIGLLLVIVWSTLAGCSMRSLAMKNMAGTFDNALSVYASENDPALVEDAMPATLKMIEVFLASAPENPQLLTTAASAYTMYTHAFLMEEADRLEDTNLARSRELRQRSKNFYLRARDYGLAALEARYPGFRTAMRKNPGQTLQQVTGRDVPLLYWTAAAWGSAIGIDTQDFSLLMDLSVVDHMIRRALELNESWSDGRLHEFMVSFEAGRAGMGGSLDAAEQHFRRALELSEGRSAGIYVTAAEALAVRTQDRERFRGLLNKALAIDVDTYPENRLANLLAQDRARWLLENVDEYFY